MPSIRIRHLLLSGLMAAVVLTGTVVKAEEPRGRLEVEAEAQLDVIPDRATLSARLWERTPAVARHADEDNDPEALRQARDRLEARAAELIEAMEAAGVIRDDIRAGSLNIQPEHVPAPRRSDSDQEMLMRTRLERPFQVRVDDLERLTRLLDALTSAGVNAMDGISYDLADRDAATDEALVMALEKASRKAELMAQTMGVALGPVTRISETRSPIYTPRMMAFSGDARESAGQAEYRPGTIVIEAGVSVSWEIEN